MKHPIRAGAAILITGLALFFSMPANSLTVQDKRAPGYPGEKVHQIRVSGVWWTVPEDVWDNCTLDDFVSACL